MELKKNDKVILKGFTGIKLGVFEVVSATKKTVTICKKNGDELVFDKNTGKQINVEEGKEKYANSIMEDDGSYVAPSTRNSKKSVKKTKAKKAAEPEETDDEEETPKKSAKKSSNKKAATKKKPEPVEEDEDEDDDEDEFEEID